MCLLFAAEACAILQAIRRSRQRQQDFYSLAFSFSQIFALSLLHFSLLRLSIYLTLSLVFGETILFLLLLCRLQWFPCLLFLSEKDTARMRYSSHPLQHAISLLLLPYLLFSFLELETYCLIKLLRHTRFLTIH